MISSQGVPMARTTSRKLDSTVQVRIPLPDREALDDWRRAQPEIPTRPEAIREAIRRLVASDRAGSARPQRRASA
jgi:Arc/MetJ-type ribon-helix-helix transcriptional regulator